ncbi:hypothetical protein [Acinetobacter bereziniae]|nr:hypothetical protein [Acinetobacter bereziniae]
MQPHLQLIEKIISLGGFLLGFHPFFGSACGSPCLAGVYEQERA